MKKIITLVITSLLLVACSSGSKKNLKKVGVVQLVEHTSLNIISNSFFERLDEMGYKDKENVDIEFVNAQGDVSSLPTIMQKMKASNVDVVVSITTPVSQSAKTISDTIPVIFCAVSDPVGANLLESIDKTDKNITGTSDPVKVEKIMELALSIHKDTKTVGYIYNPSESNSIANLEKLNKFASNNDLKVETVTITSSSELQSAARALFSKVDIVFVPNDNTVAEAMETLANEAIKNNIPLYTGADSLVMDGGFASVGVAYEDLGKETANMVDRVLKGEKISDIKVETFDKDLNIYVNVSTAKKLNITIPDEILKNDRYIEIKGK